MPDVVAELRRSLYVDDVITGSLTVAQAPRTKQGAINIMNDAMQHFSCINGTPTKSDLKIMTRFRIQMNSPLQSSN